MDKIKQLCQKYNIDESNIIDKDEIKYNRGFRWCMINGYKEFAEYLFNSSHNVIYIHRTNMIEVIKKTGIYRQINLFEELCFLGKIEEAQLLIKLFDDEIDIYRHNNIAFQVSCNNIKTVKWLWKISDGTINIRAAYNNLCFTYACYNNNIEVMKWLWNISERTIDINNILMPSLRYLDVNSLFLIPCLHNNTKMFSFLGEINNLNIVDRKSLLNCIRYAAKNDNIQILEILWSTLNNTLTYDEKYFICRVAVGGFHGSKWLCDKDYEFMEIMSHNENVLRDIIGYCNYKLKMYLSEITDINFSDALKDYYISFVTSEPISVFPYKEHQLSKFFEGYKYFTSIINNKSLLKGILSMFVSDINMLKKVHQYAILNNMELFYNLALRVSLDKNYIDSIKFLWNYIDDVIIDNNIINELLKSIAHSYNESNTWFLEKIIEKGIEINISNEPFFGELTNMAATNNNFKAYKMFLEYNVNNFDYNIGDVYNKFCHNNNLEALIFMDEVYEEDLLTENKTKSLCGDGIQSGRIINHYYEVIKHYYSYQSRDIKTFEYFKAIMKQYLFDKRKNMIGHRRYTRKNILNKIF
jgi:hypothetical protein